MSLGDLLALLLLQLAALLAPLGLGIAGVISGGTAGFSSITAWFLVGMPLSYAVVDWRTSVRARDASDGRGLGAAPPAMSRAWARRRREAASRLRVEHAVRS